MDLFAHYFFDSCHSHALDEGKKWLSNNWKLCDSLKTAEHVQMLKDFLQEVYINLAMVNYPYETNFLAPLPGNPINVSASNLEFPFSMN